MIYVEYDETQGKVKMEMSGCLGQIYAELGVVIKAIVTDETLEISVDEVFDMIKESINENYLDSTVSLTQKMIAEKGGIAEGFQDYRGQ